VRRTLSSAVLAIPWLAGVLAASIYTLLRWVGAAATDGWAHTFDWEWAPALGALLVALAAVMTVLCVR
jgi:hypothetical protein